MRTLSALAGLLVLGWTTLGLAQQAPKEEEPTPRQPRAAVPGPNAVPGIPLGEKDKTPDFSVEENMPHLSRDQVAAIGAKLRNEAGDTLGTIENIVLDRDGRVVALVVGIDKLLGLAEDRVEIDWKQVRFERKDAVVSFITQLSKDELRGQAKFSEPKRQPG
ncbi:PRC-barrel domain-containing protein [Ferrovibrio terrae]|uniref:PRC-barrel domain-containing protein n=1 Tax=Ferrovibrio terrae TaxID=2594003 RepID=UPI003137D7A8